jgi:predicted nucleic acid-binding Zn ribbon protein
MGPRSRGQRIVPLGDALDVAVRSLRDEPAASTVAGRPGALRTLAARWIDAVGPLIAAHATPVRLDGDRLVVVVDDPAWATQLRFLDADVRTRLGHVVGPDAIATIDVIVRRPDRPARASRERP